jgi:GxxExxY protein
MKLVYREEAYTIVGALFEVYREMGAGIVELVYHECVERELRSRGIECVHEPELEISYKGEILEKTCRPDFVCYSKIILELKACKSLEDNHRAQVHNYLRASGYELGLLANFGHTHQLEWERIVLTRGCSSSMAPSPPRLQS